MDRAVPKGQRSRFIDLAMHSYVDQKSRAKLRKLLHEGAEARSERDLTLADEWFALDAGQSDLP